MKHIVFISGKGGTGKSTVVAELSLLVKDKMLADCDVDAPNLHLLVKGDRLVTSDYYGASCAKIDAELCIGCGLCWATCRFGAIDERLNVLSMKCEGCGACELVCPNGAITLAEVKTGETYVDATDRGTFSHAQLDPGAEGSGKLVTEVRKNLSSFCCNHEQWALIDGSPGTGCQVISSITGADAVVAVCEPTLSGRSDLERVLGVSHHFGIPAYVCINKCDLNPEVAEQIEEFCREKEYPVIGRIPFEPGIIDALRQLKTPMEAGLTSVSEEIASMWDSLMNELS